MNESTSAELRCCCHRLLARVDSASQRVVLRCPRCKREAVLVLRAVEAGSVELRVDFRRVDP